MRLEESITVTRSNRHKNRRIFIAEQVEGIGYLDTKDVMAHVPYGHIFDSHAVGSDLFDTE
jgi:hypothetical protein